MRCLRPRVCVGGPRPNAVPHSLQVYRDPIVTELLPEATFYEAEK